MAFPAWTPTTRHDTYPAVSPTNPALSSKGKIPASVAAIKALGLSCEARYFIADVVDAPRVEAVFFAVSAEFGQIDVVVGNAGYLPDHGLLKDERLEDWWCAFQVNALGAFTVLQAFLRHATRDATFISIASALAHLYFPGFSSYGASKLAVVKLLQDVQEEWPERRFFSVQPGLIDTETSSKSNLPGNDTVDLPAGSCVWLASAEANFLKGRMLWANWDVEELKAKKEHIL